MTYYDKLMKQVERCMALHPSSTVVMDSDTLKVLASGKDTKKLARKVHRAKNSHGLTVVFEQKNENAVWILPRR